MAPALDLVVVVVDASFSCGIVLPLPIGLCFSPALPHAHTAWQGPSPSRMPSPGSGGHGWHGLIAPGCAPPGAHPSAWGHARDGDLSAALTCLLLVSPGTTAQHRHLPLLLLLLRAAGCNPDFPLKLKGASAAESCWSRSDQGRSAFRPLWRGGHHRPRGSSNGTGRCHLAGY